jgi:hypothetical protein
MAELSSKTSRFQSRLSWAMVVFGLALLHLLRTPALPEQFAQWGQVWSVQDVKVLGLLLAISAVPCFGLWRLSPALGLPRWFAALFPCFPLAVVGVYVVKPLLDRIRPPR